MEDPHRILLVIDSLDIGGAERHVTDLSSSLRARGYEVSVVCSTSGPLAEYLEAADVPVFPLLGETVKRRLSLHYARALRRQAEVYRPDLIHAHLFSSVTASALITPALGIPLVVTDHTEARWQGPAEAGLDGWAHVQADRAIAVSSAVRSHLIDDLDVPEEKVTVIHNSVSPVPTEPVSLPVGCGESPLVGVVARLHPEKGVGHFLEAAAGVAPQFPHVRFVVVGDGPLRQQLQERAEELGIAHQVHFLGSVPNARSLVAAFDVLVVPSLSEGGPLVALEAAVAGTPLVATRTGLVPDVFSHEVDALLVPPGDTWALHRAMGDMLADPARARRMAEKARLEAARWTPADQVEATLDVYRQVMPVEVPRARRETARASGCCGAAARSPYSSQ